MNRSYLKLGLTVGLLTLLLLLVSACSQDSKTTTSEEPKNSGGAASSEEENGEPKNGGTYTIMEASSPHSLNPFITSSINTHNHIGLVYNKLVTYETGPDVEFNEYNVIPDLAEDWEISEDGKVFTFFLRDTTWHDVEPVNGREFVADDVVATMEHIMNLPGHQATYLSEVESVIALDDKTVEFTLNQPFSPFVNFMADHFMWIVPEEAINGEINLDREAIGTGPFILEKFEDNIGATFARNPNYFEEGKPYLDEVKFKTVPDQGARIAAFRSGEADYIGALSPEETESLSRTTPDAIIDERILGTHIAVFMNMEREPFDNLLVRKAVSMALDAQNGVDSIFGKGIVSSPVNPSLEGWGLPEEEREELQPYDPEKAKELLAEAGYPDGFSTKVMTTDAYGEQLGRMAQWIVEDLRSIGINAEIEMTEYATYYSDRWPNLDYDMGVGYPTLYQEADGWLSLQFKTGGAKNWFGISDPKLDDMLDEQRLIFDEDERIAKVHDIQRYILEEVVNPIPVATSYSLVPRQTHVKNYNPHIAYGNIHLKDVWLDK